MSPTPRRRPDPDMLAAAGARGWAAVDHRTAPGRRRLPVVPRLAGRATLLGGARGAGGHRGVYRLAGVRQRGHPHR
ncbi:MAG: hypothetical protein V9F04_02175 [Dermatophilaceae bacterium]